MSWAELNSVVPGGVCVRHRGGGGVAYALSEARANEGTLVRASLRGAATVPQRPTLTCCHLRVRICECVRVKDSMGILF